MSKWFPELMYEEGGGGSSSKIPFIPVPEGEEMPKILFVFESRETGELEPGSDGEEVPVVQWDLHQYADMAILKEGLSSDVYDKVRGALGLESLKSASEKGKSITDIIRSQLS
jgi:hypothetical protein